MSVYGRAPLSFMPITYPPWSSEQDALMKQRYPSEGVSEVLVGLLGRTTRAVRKRAHDLGLTRPRSPIWTKEEIEIMVEHYGKISSDELMALLPGRLWTAILGKASKLKLSENTVWSTTEDEILRDCYPSGRWRVMRKRLSDRSIHSVHSRAKVLGIKMTEEAKKRIHRESRQRKGYRIFQSYGKVLGSVISHTLAAAESRGLDVSLLDGKLENMQYLDSIAHDYCVLSGRPITYKRFPRDSFSTASLDRIDSAKGYVKGNVQWIHKEVNRMKSDLSDEQFIAFCCEVARFRGHLS